MLKKIFVTALLMTLSFIGSQIFSSNVCSAGVNVKEICLGGLTFHDTPDKVTKMYGQPLSADWDVPISSRIGEKGDIWRYGDGVEIVFYAGSSDQPKIVSITVSSNNGWKTPSGLAVGMDIEDAVKRYGGTPFDSKIADDKGVGVYYYTGERFPDASLWIVFDKTSHKILKLCVRNYGIPNIGGYDLDGMIKWLLK